MDVYYGNNYYMATDEEDDDYPPYCLKRSDSSGSVTESSISSESEHGSNNNFSYEEHCGPGLKSFLVKRLKSHLLRSLEISPLFLDKISNDILRMSEKEPYGIRGATVIFKLHDSKGKECKGQLQPLKIDAGCVSTFRLIFNLKEERYMISNIGRALHGFFFKSWKRSAHEECRTRIALDDYTLSKRQLYRSFEFF